MRWAEFAGLVWARMRPQLPWIVWTGLWSAGVMALTGLWAGDTQLTTVHSPVLQRQARALVDGHFHIGTDIGAIEFDQASGERGIQQVWGLGIAIYLLSLSLLVSGSASELVPDRLAYGIALWMVLGLYGRALMRSRLGESGAAEAGIPGRVVAWIGLPMGVMVCGGLFHMMDSKFEIYEETVAYSVLAGLAVSALLLIHLRGGGFISLIGMCLLAGLMVFVRPTSVAFGAMACACGVIRNRHRAPRWMAAMAAFAVPVFACAWTNQIRFGSATEFGHEINGTTNDELLLVTHFPGPRGEDVGLGSQLMELVGGLAFDPMPGGPGTHAKVFTFQSSAVRWREGYLPALGLPALVLSAVSLGWQWAVTRGRGRDASGSIALSQYWVGFNLAAIGLLTLFYCRYPVLSSRYLFDFGTGLANLALLPWIVVASPVARTRGRWMVVWIAVAIWAVVDATARQRPQAGAKSGPPWVESKPSVARGSDVTVGLGNPCRAHCELDGVGWDCRTGRVDLCSLHALPPCRTVTFRCIAAPEVQGRLASLVRLRVHDQLIKPRIEFSSSEDCHIEFDLSGCTLTRPTLVFAKWGEIAASGPIRVPVRLIGLEVVR